MYTLPNYLLCSKIALFQARNEIYVNMNHVFSKTVFLDTGILSHNYHAQCIVQALI